ncbi:MAG: hypothetical protein O2U61_02570 [Candidatus Bathyarchaeota archaeon]|nr:hypothetical protein [Candidatus Bathyarchaeota archaeon]
MILKNQFPIQQILALCNEIRNDYSLIGACIYGSKVYGCGDVNSPYDCLLILQDYERGIRYNYRKLGKESDISFLIVDRELFEIDVNNGKVGDFLSNRILTPYIVTMNSNYFAEKELLFKKRIIKEELENLIIEYGELSRSLLIKPEYFATARMVKRAKVFPPLGYSYSKLLNDSIAMKSIVKSFNEAIEGMAKEGFITIDDQNILPSNHFINNIISKRTLKKVVNILEQSKASLYSYLMHGKAGLVDLDTISKELTFRTRKDLSKIIRKKHMKDPRDYLHLRVSNGTVCLNDKSSITEILKRMKPNANIEITPLTGVLNEVYLVKVDDEKIVAKKFTDWHSLKWFVLNIFALGTKTFYLSGKNRLQNEISTNIFLTDNKISVPSILHVSLPRGIVFRQFIEGSIITNIVKENINSEDLPKPSKECFYQLGKFFANIHDLGIELGDTKPENFIMDDDGQIFALDLEQSKRNGDASWDIAEFLYYSGHYAILPKKGLKKMMHSFIDGYLEIGDYSILKKAANLSYIKVFSFWTSPQVMFTISEILRNSVKKSRR